jgi:hypothetical protein
LGPAAARLRLPRVSASQRRMHGADAGLLYLQRCLTARS